MNSEQAEGNLDKFTRAIKKTWNKLTSDEIENYHGNSKKFYNAIKTKYGITREEAEKSVKEIEKAAKNKAA
jgi:uncharacterized protein YjbJ (UPF0337 family)